MADTMLAARFAEIEAAKLDKAHWEQTITTLEEQKATIERELSEAHRRLMVASRALIAAEAASDPDAPKLEKPKRMTVTGWRGQELEIDFVQTSTGSYREIRNRWGEVKRWNIDRRWEVRLLDGTVIGQVEFRMVTRETQSKGKRYVNSRWQSPGWTYTVRGGGVRSLDAGGKQDAIERIVRNWSC